MEHYNDFSLILRNKISEHRTSEKKYGALYRHLVEGEPMEENNNQPNIDEDSISIKVVKDEIRADSLPVGQSFVYSSPSDKTFSYVYEAKIEQFIKTDKTLLIKIKRPSDKYGQWYSINKFHMLVKILGLIENEN